jgi:hypothetical protein
VPVLADLMLGLPGMTLETLKSDLQACFEQDISTRVFTTLVLENSPMNEPDYRRRFRIETDEYCQIISTTSFTAEERDRAIELRNAFRFADHFGALRHVLRFVAHETGQREIDVFCTVLDRVTAQPGAFPSFAFAVRHARRYLTTTMGFALLLREARQIVLEEYDLDPAQGLDVVLRLQQLLLPSDHRSYPIVAELDLDAVEYLRRLLTEEREQVPPLSSFDPGKLVVEQPPGWGLEGLMQPAPPLVNADGRAVLLDEFGWNEDNNWELDSPIARNMRGSYTR